MKDCYLFVSAAKIILMKYLAKTNSSRLFIAQMMIIHINSF